MAKPFDVRDYVPFDGRLHPLTDEYRGDIKCGPGLTKQSFKEACDINTILKQFERTGVVSHLNERKPIWGFDLTSVPEFQKAQAQVLAAKAAFANLPSKVRGRFHNDPKEMLAFLYDKENRDEAVKLGLVKPPEVVVIPEAKPKENLDQKPA